MQPLNRLRMLSIRSHELLGQIRKTLDGDVSSSFLALTPSTCISSRLATSFGLLTTLGLEPGLDCCPPLPLLFASPVLGVLLEAWSPVN